VRGRAGGETLAPASPVRRFAPRHRAARGLINTVWTHVVPDDVHVLRVLPDAAIDLVFAGDHLRVAGPDTAAVLEPIPPGARIVGFQLCAGAAARVLGVPASAVRDERVDIREVWGPTGAAVAESMLEARTVERSADVLETALVRRQLRAGESDQLAPVLVERVRAVRGAASMSTLADELGLSVRQLHRRCMAAFGYGPKVLARIVRLQSALADLRDRFDTPLAQLAADSGYADQAHLSHEFAALTGTTPAAVRSELAAVSDSDKTAAA
jgi:AraC-like DNA-binding protein